MRTKRAKPYGSEILRTTIGCYSESVDYMQYIYLQVLQYLSSSSMFHCQIVMQDE